MPTKIIRSSNDYLEHHGIIGQKWGVRRYQNEDGTLTEAGRQRYSIGAESGSSQKPLTRRQARKERKAITKEFREEQKIVDNLITKYGKEQVEEATKSWRRASKYAN